MGITSLHFGERCKLGVIKQLVEVIQVVKEAPTQIYILIRCRELFLQDKAEVEKYKINMEKQERPRS